MVIELGGRGLFGHDWLNDWWMANLGFSTVFSYNNWLVSNGLGSLPWLQVSEYLFYQRQVEEATQRNNQKQAEALLEEIVTVIEGDSDTDRPSNDIVAIDFASEYGTTFEKLSHQMSTIEGVLDISFRKFAGRDAIVTFTTNGDHTKDSLHPFGNAMDLRTRDMSIEQINQTMDSIKQSLWAPGDYDVVYEGKREKHIHIEYQPKKPR
jgi:hypothetical protein